MATAAPMVWITIFMSIFLVLIPIALLVVLQVWLCKKSKKLGLILPILSFLMSLLLVLSVGTVQTIRGGSVQITDEHGTVIQEEHQHHTEFTPGAMRAIAGMFLVSNIPTVVFGGIWLHYKNRRDFQDDLKKMKIEDLE